jgi:hypothetical protein
LSVMQDGGASVSTPTNGAINASVSPSRTAIGSRLALVRALPSRVASVAAQVESGTSSGLAPD